MSWCRPRLGLATVPYTHDHRHLLFLPDISSVSQRQWMDGMTGHPRHTRDNENPAALAAYWSIPFEQLLTELHSSPNGLSQDEAKRRVYQYGPNSITAASQTTVCGLLLSQFKSPLVLILVFAAIISVIAGEWPDAVIVLAVVLGSTTLGFVQEYRASDAIEKLRSRVTAQVQRGARRSIVHGALQTRRAGRCGTALCGQSDSSRWGRSGGKRSVCEPGGPDRRSLSGGKEARIVWRPTPA